MKKLIYLFLILGISTTAALADAAQNKLYECKEVLQTNASPFACPNLLAETASNIPLTHTLDNINYSTNSYRCTYQNTSGKIVASCNHQDKNLAQRKKDLRKKFVGSMGVNMSAAVLTQRPRVYKKGEFYNLAKINAFSLDGKIGKKTFAGGVPAELKADGLGGGSDALNLRLKNLFKNALQMDTYEETGAMNPNLPSLPTAAVNYFTVAGDTEKHIFDNLVKPYLSGTAPAENKTFSAFISSMLTMDSRAISGYDQGTGKLSVSAAWKAPLAKNPPLPLSNVKADGTIFDGTYHNIVDGDTSITLNNINTWQEIFTGRLWGFYYNYMNMVDLGVDAISTFLFFAMSIWFFAANGFREATSHLINKEGSFGKGEQYWAKGVAVVLTLAFFFLSYSIPNATPIDKSNYQANYTPKHNNTLAKESIRYGARLGDVFASTLTDLSTAAMLTYLSKDQGLKSLANIRGGVEDAAINMVNYYEASKTLQECSNLYGLTESEWSSVNVNSSFNIDGEYLKPTAPVFFTNRRISSLGRDACVQSLNTKIIAIQTLVTAIKQSELSLDGSAVYAANAVKAIIINQTALSKSMGWVSVFSLPLSYFTLKEGDFFLTPAADYSQIEEEAQKYIKKITVNDNNFMTKHPLAKKQYFASNTVSDTEDAAGWATAKMVSLSSVFMVHNILPGFSEMHKSAMTFLTSVTGVSTDPSKNKKEDTVSVTDVIFKSMPGINMLGGAKALILKLAGPALIYFGAGAMALYGWKMAFSALFIIAVSMAMLMKIVLFFVELIVHFIGSIFVFVWAFAKPNGEGEQKIVSFAKDTFVIILFYPSLIALSSVLFIFFYELFFQLYSFIGGSVFQANEDLIGLAGMANNDTDSFFAYLNHNMMLTLMEAVVKLIALIGAIFMFFFFPEMFLKKLGLAGEGMTITNSAKELQGQSGRYTNPISKG